MLGRKGVSFIDHLAIMISKRQCLWQDHVMHYQSTLLQVVAFCDVDVKKINKSLYIYEESDVCIV